MDRLIPDDSHWLDHRGVDAVQQEAARLSMSAGVHLGQGVAAGLALHEAYPGQRSESSTLSEFFQSDWTLPPVGSVIQGNAMLSGHTLNVARASEYDRTFLQMVSPPTPSAGQGTSGGGDAPRGRRKRRAGDAHSGNAETKRSRHADLLNWTYVKHSTYGLFMVRVGSLLRVFRGVVPLAGSFGLAVNMQAEGWTTVEEVHALVMEMMKDPRRKIFSASDATRQAVAQQVQELQARIQALLESCGSAAPVMEEPEQLRDVSDATDMEHPRARARLKNVARPIATPLGRMWRWKEAFGNTDREPGTEQAQAQQCSTVQGLLEAMCFSLLQKIPLAPDVLLQWRRDMSCDPHPYPALSVLLEHMMPEAAPLSPGAYDDGDTTGDPSRQASPLSELYAALGSFVYQEAVVRVSERDKHRAPADLRERRNGAPWQTPQQLARIQRTLGRADVAASMIVCFGDFNTPSVVWHCGLMTMDLGCYTLALAFFDLAMTQLESLNIETRPLEDVFVTGDVHMFTIGFWKLATLHSKARAIRKLADAAQESGTVDAKVADTLRRRSLAMLTQARDLCLRYFDADPLNGQGNPSPGSDAASVNCGPPRSPTDSPGVARSRRVLMKKLGFTFVELAKIALSLDNLRGACEAAQSACDMFARPPFSPGHTYNAYAELVMARVSLAASVSGGHPVRVGASPELLRSEALRHALSAFVIRRSLLESEEALSDPSKIVNPATHSALNVITQILGQGHPGIRMILSTAGSAAQLFQAAMGMCPVMPVHIAASGSMHQPMQHLQQYQHPQQQQQQHQQQHQSYTPMEQLHTLPAAQAATAAAAAVNATTDNKPDIVVPAPPTPPPPGTLHRRSLRFAYNNSNKVKLRNLSPDMEVIDVRDYLVNEHGFPAPGIAPGDILLYREDNTPVDLFLPIHQATSDNEVLHVVVQPSFPATSNSLS